MSNRFLALSTPIAAALILSAGCDRQGNEFVPPPPPAVTVAPPLVQDVTRYLELPGRLEAVDAVEIRARVRGFLETVDFEPSSIVNKGDLLFTIERDTYEAALNTAKGSLTQMQAAESLAQATLERVKAAFAQGGVSEIEVIEAEAHLEAAKGAVEEAQATVRSAEIDLGFTEIHSPVRGRVDRELVDAGNLVGSGESTLLTTVLAEDPIYAYFNLNERDLLRLLNNRGRKDSPRSDVPVFITLSDSTEYPTKGNIDFASNRVNTDTGTIEVRAVFPNPDAQLFPGLFVKVRLPESSDQAILVPPEVVGRDVAGSYVLVVGDDNTVERRGVVLGPAVKEGQVIDEGIEATDRVIVNGWQRARPGAKVNPTEKTQG